MSWYRHLLTMSTYEETARCCTTGRGSQLCIVDKKHDELKSFDRFWYQERRDFLNSKRTVELKWVFNKGRVNTGPHGPFNYTDF